MLGKATSNTNCVMHCESFVAHGDAAPSCFGGLWPSTWWANGATLNKGPGVGNEFRHPNGAPRSMEIWFLVSFVLGLKRQCQTYCKTTTFVASWTKPRWRVSAVHTQHNIWTIWTSLLVYNCANWCWKLRSRCTMVYHPTECLHSTVKEPGAPYMRETPTWSMAAWP